MSAPSIILHTGRLSPLSVGTVSLVQLGTDELHQVELIQLVQNPYALSNPADPLPSAAATVTSVQAGTSELPDIQRITLSPRPYDGAFTFTISGEQFTEVPFDITMRDLQALVGAAYIVEKKAANSWQFKTAANGAIAAITIDTAHLIVPRGVSGLLTLNTEAFLLAFQASPAKFLYFTCEVQIQWPGEDPQTVFQDTIEVGRNVINLNTLVSATLLGLQTSYSALVGDLGFTYSNTITGLTTGLAPLSAVTTAAKTLGYRYDFDLNDEMETWILKSGAADATDPTGQVAPFDFNSGTNNKHWQKEGGY